MTRTKVARGIGLGHDSEMELFRKSAGVVLVLIIVVALVVGAASQIGAAPLKTKKFKMPSRNIGCRIHDGFLRCDIRSGLKPEPKRECGLDWTGMVLAHDGRAAPNCAGDTIFPRKAPVLRYGHKWKRARIVCTSRRSGLRCNNNVDHGFFLSRNDWDRH